jgi:hypothetical protein
MGSLLGVVTLRLLTFALCCMLESTNAKKSHELQANQAKPTAKTSNSAVARASLGGTKTIKENSDKDRNKNDKGNKSKAREDRGKKENKVS